MANRMTSTEIRKLVKAGNFIIGTGRTLKSLKLGKIDKVIISSNCPDRVSKSISHYAALSNAETFSVPYPNEELGVICKKPYSISVLSILKHPGAK